MLAESGLSAGHVPVGHPAELLPLVVLQHDEEGIHRDLFFLFAQPGLQSFGKEGRYYFEVTVTLTKLKIEAQAQFALCAANWAPFRYRSGKLVQSLKQRMVRGDSLTTLRAVVVLGGHDR